MDFDMNAFFEELDALLDECPMPGNAAGLETESNEPESVEVLQ